MKRYLAEIGILTLIIIVAAGLISLFRNATSFSAIFEDTTCNPPCWNRIKPNETLMWEAVNILENMGNTSRILTDTEKYGYEISWSFSYPVKESGGYIYCLESSVSAISILTYDDSLDVAKTVDKFGKPNNIWIRYRETSSGYWMDVVLEYREKGIFVELEVDLLNTADVRSITIDERNPIQRVIYIDPEKYEELLSSRILFREDLNTINELIQPWKGLNEEYIEK